MLELIALFMPISAFPFTVVITDDTASGIDVHAPRNIIPIMLSVDERNCGYKLIN
jgi:hypothetical protein